MRKTASLFVILPALLLSSCGTILNGTYQRIGVSSNPTGADVSADGIDVGRTPVILELKRNDDHHIRLTLDGYAPFEMPVTSRVNGLVVVGDILLTGLLGIAVDAITGGMYMLTPEDVRGELRKDGTGAVLEEGEIYVAVVMTPDPNWKKIGQLQPVKYGNRNRD